MHLVFSAKRKPFDRPSSVAGTLAASFKFTGEIHDDAPGLVYLRARQHDPDLGRFVSAERCRSSYNRTAPYQRLMEYRIVLKKGQDGYYVAQCLEVPGAISQGRTKEEALRNAKEALELVLDVLKEEAKKGEIARVRVNA